MEKDSLMSKLDLNFLLYKCKTHIFVQIFTPFKSVSHCGSSYITSLWFGLNQLCTSLYSFLLFLFQKMLTFCQASWGLSVNSSFQVLSHIVASFFMSGPTWPHQDTNIVVLKPSTAGCGEA